MTKVAFIGAGKLGGPVSEVMSEHYEVKVHDPKLNTDMKEVCEDADIIFVAVPTPHEAAYGGEKPTYNLTPTDFSYEILKDVLIDLNDYARDCLLYTSPSPRDPE